MIRFVYPNVNVKENKFIGCGRYIALTHDEEVSEEYKRSEQLPHITEIMIAVGKLMGESFDPGKDVYHKQDNPTGVYKGRSRELAYLLTLISCSNSVAIKGIQRDIWCTGSITESPILKEVESSTFDTKLDAFLSLNNPDNLFIVPLPNITPERKSRILEKDAKDVSLKQFYDLPIQQRAKQKIVLKVAGDQLEQLIELIFGIISPTTLRRELEKYEKNMRRCVRPSTVSFTPYKDLEPFKIGEADIFFRSESVEEDFYQKIHANFLTILCGKSGTGKTSLLNAWLSKRLIDNLHLPVYLRKYQKSPVDAIKEVITPSVRDTTIPLHNYLQQVCDYRNHQTQEVVIILDQFEKFFTDWADSAHEFIQILETCHDKRLPVRFIISIRENDFPKLVSSLPAPSEMPYTIYDLGPMTRKEVESAITLPIKKQARHYEPALKDKLVEDLEQRGMRPPHLQIICHKLYETLPENEATIPLSLYEKLGQADGILGEDLDQKLETWLGKRKGIGKEVLKKLVGSQNTSWVLQYRELANQIKPEGSELADVLELLVEKRLLRQEEKEGEQTYEIVHEYLIEQIRPWLTLKDVQFKEARDLLTREVTSWEHGSLIQKDRLELIYEQRERFQYWHDEQTLECLLRSALETDFNLRDWPTLRGENREPLLLKVLATPDSETSRRAAIRELGHVWDFEDVKNLGHEDGKERQKAAKALGTLKDERAIKPLVSALQDADSFVRWEAAKALGTFTASEAVEALIAALEDKGSRVRLKAAEILGNMKAQKAVEPLIRILQETSAYQRLRITAAKALGEIGDERAIESLRALKERADADDVVKEAAENALSHINAKKG